MKLPYTVRYAHLRLPVSYEAGDILSRGDPIGTMGNTGQSTGPHLHIDVVHGGVSDMYRLGDIGSGLQPAFEQLSHFIDEELGGPFRVTTYPYDYRSKMKGGKWKAHPGYDLVIEAGIPKIFWNRSMVGEVLRHGFDPSYGNFIQIGFQA